MIEENSAASMAQVTWNTQGSVPGLLTDGFCVLVKASGVREFTEFRKKMEDVTK